MKHLRLSFAVYVYPLLFQALQCPEFIIDVFKPFVLIKKKYPLMFTPSLIFVITSFINELLVGILQVFNKPYKV